MRSAWRRWGVTAQCLLAAASSVLVLGWLATASQHTRLGQAVDVAASRAVIGDEVTTRRLLGILGEVSIASVAVAVAVLVGLAVLRRRWVAALGALVLVGGANVTTQVLKHLLARSDFGMLTVPSLPSGHSTVAVSLVLAALLVVPATLRLAVSLLGSMACTVVGSATLVAGWHRPSDVLAALLVSLTWGMLVVVAGELLVGGGSRPARAPHGLLSLSGVVLGSVLLIVLGVRPHGGWSGLLDAGIVLAGVGVACAATVRLFAELSTPLALSQSRTAAPPAPREDSREAQSMSA